MDQQQHPSGFGGGYVTIKWLLNKSGGYVGVLDFREKITSFACFFRLGLNCIFVW